MHESKDRLIRLRQELIASAGAHGRDAARYDRCGAVGPACFAAHVAASYALNAQAIDDVLRAADPQTGGTR